MAQLFSEACERNKQPILERLQQELIAPARVLEIGSGTGQHAVWFCEHLPHLRWQPSDRVEVFKDLRDSLPNPRPVNLLEPIELDVTQPSWALAGQFDAVYSANTLHIMSWNAVERFCAHLPTALTNQGLFVVYGPFNYDGKYTSESNAYFDAQLRNRDPESRIRDFEAVDELLSKGGLKLVSDSAMPANNRLIIWQL